MAPREARALRSTTSPTQCPQRRLQIPRAVSMPEPNLSSFMWSVADLLRGDYKQSKYGKVTSPSRTRTRGS